MKNQYISLMIDFNKTLGNALNCATNDIDRDALQRGLKITRSIIDNGIFDKTLYLRLNRYYSDCLPWEYGITDAWLQIDRIVRKSREFKKSKEK